MRGFSASSAYLFTFMYVLSLWMPGIMYSFNRCYLLWVYSVGDPRPETQGSPWVNPDPEDMGPGR